MEDEKEEREKHRRSIFHGFSVTAGAGASPDFFANTNPKKVQY